METVARRLDSVTELEGLTGPTHEQTRTGCSDMSSRDRLDYPRPAALSQGRSQQLYSLSEANAKPPAQKTKFQTKGNALLSELITSGISVATATACTNPLGEFGFYILLPAGCCIQEHMSRSTTLMLNDLLMLTADAKR